MVGLSRLYVSLNAPSPEWELQSHPVRIWALAHVYLEFAPDLTKGIIHTSDISAPSPMAT